jgi:glucokinase
MTVLAGDIGGTNARLALFEAGAPQAAIGEPIFEQIYPSASRPSLDVIIEEFLAAAARALGTGPAQVTQACLGIAGPIENNICRATNLPWVVDGRALSQRVGIPRVTLVNDFYAAALSVTAVGAD